MRHARVFGIWLAIVSAAQVSLAQDPSVATLSTITTSAGKLSPEFSPGRKAYVVHVASYVDNVTITATSAVPETDVVISNAAPARGEASSTIALPVGRTILPIDAVQGGQRSTYTLKIIRDTPIPVWTQAVGEAPFLPRDSAGELVFDGRMWIFGGYTPDLVSDVWSSRDGLAWNHEGNIPNAVGVNIPINLVFNGRMWVVCNDGRLYSSANGVDWDLVTENAPWAGRYAAGGAVFKDRMWVMGGMKGGEPFNDVWSSADGVTWNREVENAPWSPRQMFGLVAVFNDKLWILGGGITNYHPFKAYNDVWNSADGRNWTRVTDAAPWPGRIWSTATVYRDRLWVMGGFQSEPRWTNLADVWYSADGVQWTRFETERSWSPRHEHSLMVHDDKLWVVAGNEWPLKNDVWYLQIPGLTFVTQPTIEDYARTEYTYRARADFGGSGVRYRLLEAPAWLAVDVKTGVVKGTPPEPGDYPISLEASDTSGATATQAFTLHALPFR